MQVPLLRLQCGVNSYEWGKKGDDSAAAKFAAATPADGFSIQSDKPYAEVREDYSSANSIWDLY
jgi:mannose-6-phosphate isomerase